VTWSIHVAIEENTLPIHSRRYSGWRIASNTLRSSNAAKYRGLLDELTAISCRASALWLSVEEELRKNLRGPLTRTKEARFLGGFVFCYNTRAPIASTYTRGNGAFVYQNYNQPPGPE
jgi:hypothetical protein